MRLRFSGLVPAFVIRNLTLDHLTAQRQLGVTERTMAEKAELSVLKKFLDVMDYGHAALQQFPRHQRHVLAQRIDNCMTDIMELIITANLRYHKKTTLNELDIKMHLLRYQIRLAMQRKYLTVHRYEVMSRLIDEVGRMIGGWVKWARKPPENTADQGLSV